MRRQPGRSPEEGATLSAADAPRRTFATGRRCGRRRRDGSLFAASAGSSALSPLSPSPPSSDGTRASGSGGPAIASASVQLSGLVALGPGYLRLKLLAAEPGRIPKDVVMKQQQQQQQQSAHCCVSRFPGEIAQRREDSTA